MCWKRGDSLEIITPFSTVTDKYISVFLLKSGDRWIVRDGAAISTGVYTYDTHISLENDVSNFFMKEHGVSITLNKYNKILYYLATNIRIVYELSTFIINVVFKMD